MGGDRWGPVVPYPDGRPERSRHQGCHCDIALQQVLTRPDEFDVIATPNLNGEYLSARSPPGGRHRIAPGGTSLTD